MARLFLSLSDEEHKQFLKACDKAGMTRSQYLRFLINGRRDIRPPVLQYRRLIKVLSEIERDLKVIAMKEGMTDNEKILIMEKLKEIKEALSDRFKKEEDDGH